MEKAGIKNIENKLVINKILLLMARNQQLNNAIITLKAIDIKISFWIDVYFSAINPKKIEDIKYVDTDKIL